jgi:hypothetical protein
MPVAFSPRILGVTAVLTALSLALTGETSSREQRLLGGAQPLGAGTVQSFMTLDRSGAPLALGIILSHGALEQLPQKPNTISRCFDADGNGRHTEHECMGDEERILELPAAAPPLLPFRWIMVNWNPAGHHAPYARPHFDFHFYMTERSEVESIRPGRCGEMVDCGDFKLGSAPVPSRYVPAAYIDVGVVAPRMGNHLLDSMSPELKDSLPFSSTFIFGAYRGRVTFWEPMITRDFIVGSRNSCLQIRQPKAFARSGYYPTQYCVRQAKDGARTITLERFRYSDAV